MPYIRESALEEITHAQHDAIAQAKDLRAAATRLKNGAADIRDAAMLERIANKLDIFSHIVTEPAAKADKADRSSRVAHA